MPQSPTGRPTWKMRRVKAEGEEKAEGDADKPKEEDDPAAALMKEMAKEKAAGK